MPIIVRHEEQAKHSISDNAAIISVLTHAISKNDCVEVDRVQLANGGSKTANVADNAIGWLLVLAGEGHLAGQKIDRSNAIYLAPGYEGEIQADSDLDILWTKVPRAGRFDPDLVTDRPEARFLDWTREPVLQSEHDARTRVYMATPKLTGTTAVKSEMIVYPPGSAAPEHHHVGAEHFQYIISGRGTAVLDGRHHEMGPGDMLYNYEHERHFFLNSSDNPDDFVFVEFFVPGACETVWSPGANVCAWVPTGKDIKGQKPSRDIAYHVHGDDKGL